MSEPTLNDLAARIAAVKSASMLAKPAQAEIALESFMQYLAEQDARIRKLEEGADHGNR